MALRKKITHEIYALTLSPPIRHGDAEYLYSGDKFLMRKILNRCTDHYMVYPEFDDSTRLHYHGTIIVKDIIKFHKHTKKMLKAHFNFIKLSKLKTFKDHLIWTYYMRKDWGINKVLFNRPVLPRHIKKRKPKNLMLSIDDLLVKYGKET